MKALSTIKIGKFDIFATYIYAKDLLEGKPEKDAKEHGYVIAVIGAQARMGNFMSKNKVSAANPMAAMKAAASAKKKKEISYKDFDKLIQKMGEDFFKKVFYPVIKSLVEEGYTYDQVKVAVDIPKTWGAKKAGDEFVKTFKSRISAKDLKALA